MVESINLKTILSQEDNGSGQPREIFALLNLGILDSLTNGAISATEALQLFFNADNCLFVHQSLKDPNADAIMSHGVQLADLFDILPPKDAQREFQRELAAMRALCMALLERERAFA